MPELILGIDVGTTSLSALVIDLEGQVHGQARRWIESAHPAPGRVEQDPREVWRRVTDAIAEALESAGRGPGDLAAIGVAAQRSSVVLWSRADGEAVGPMILWNDLRGTERATELQSAGYFVMPQAAAAKLEAAIDDVDRGRARAAGGELVWGTLDSFLVQRLSGGALHTTDLSNAWSTCYLDLSTMRDWNTALIDFQEIPDGIFPALCDTYGALGETAISGLGAKVPLCAIVADQQSGMFAHDAWCPGDWKASYGTSAALMVSTGDRPMLAPGLTPMLQAAHRGANSFAIEGMVASAGNLLDWLIHGLGLYGSVRDITEAARSVDGTHGVSIRPALHGLGAPHNDAQSRAAIVGLSAGSTRAHIACAAFESLAFRVREIAEVAAGIDGIDVPETLPVDGGLATNDYFLQIQADLLGRPVARHVQSEAAALGACMAAAIGAGLATREDLAPLAQSVSSFDPAIGPEEAEARFSQWRVAVGLDTDEPVGA